MSKIDARATRAMVVMPSLLTLAVLVMGAAAGSAQAQGWSNPSVTLSLPDDNVCIVGPNANGTLTEVQIQWTAFNNDSAPGRTLSLGIWVEANDTAGAVESYFDAPAGQLPLQTTTFDVVGNYLSNGSEAYFGLQNDWVSGDIWSLTTAPYEAPDLAAPDVGLSGYTMIDMTTDPDCADVPEIGVTGNGVNITDGDSSPQTADHTDFGSADISSGAVSRTFTITNSGTGTLTLGSNAASLSGTHAADFSITSQPAASVGSGGSTTVTVRFDPSLVGTRSATLSIANNDSNESPFNFAIQGAGAGAPEISVSSSESGAVADGGTDTFTSSPAAGSFSTVIYTISNIGTGTLSLNNRRITNTSNVGIRTASFDSTTVAPGSSTRLVVDYTPTNNGPFSFDIEIRNSDSNEDPFNISVSGDAIGPEIEVSSSEGGAITDGGTDTFVSTPVAGSTASVTYTITNSGAVTLNLTAPGFAWNRSNVDVFNIVLADTSVPPAGSTTLTMDYRPIDPGAFGFNLLLQNDDIDEDLFSISASGTAIGVPEIALSSSEGGPVADGGIDTFVSTPAAGSATTVTYTITNSGTDTLTLTTPSVASNISGTSNVTVNSLSLASTSIAAGGGTTTLALNYTPTTNGPFGFSLALNSDDSDENPYNISASGTARPVAITSIERRTPSTTITNADSLTFRVTFSDPVQNVDAADFDATGTTGDAASVSAISATTYDVTVSGGNLASYDGGVGLTFAGAQNIESTGGGALTGTTPTGANETFTVDNTAPSGYSIAFDQDPVTFANAGSASVSFSGAEVGAAYAVTISSVGGGSNIVASGTIANPTDQITRDLSGLGDGALTVSATLTDAAGNAGSAATDTAQKASPPSFSAAFTPASISVGGASTLVHTINNSSASAAASALDFTHSLPAGVTVATPANASTTCTGGTVNAVAGGGTVSYSRGTASAGASCTVSMDVTASSAGSFVSVTGDLTSSLGNSGTASDTLTAAALNVTLAVSPLSFSENGGTTTLTATLSGTSTQDVTVDLAYTGSAATGPAQIIVLAGNTSGTATVTGVDNAIDEADRSVTVEIDSVANGTEDGTQSVTLTVTDDDGAPGLSIGDVSVTEGDSGSTNVNFTVTLSAASGNTVTVDYASANDTATAGQDYTAAAGTLSFAPGETSKTIAVTVAGDDVTELDEAFTVTLTTPVNAALADAEAIGTITNDDAATISIADVTQTEGNSGTSPFVFTVSLSGPVDTAISVDAASADGSATIAGGDYAANSGQLDFAAGVTSQTFTVTVNGDAAFEPTETFTVQLSNLQAAGRDVSISDAEGTGTITNDDNAPSVTLAASPLSLSENGGTTTLTTTLSGTSTQDVTVDLAYTGSAATGPVQIIVLAGNTSGTATVTGVDNAIDEADRSVAVEIDSVANGTEDGTQSVALTVTDDDGAPGLSIGDASVTEGDSGTSTANFTVTLSAASGNTVTVDYSSADSTATISDGDYTAISGTLSFTPGETSKTIAVTVAGDDVTELDEAFTVTLTTPVNAALVDAEAIGTIANDDAASLSIADVTQAETDSGTTAFIFTVSLSGPVDTLVSVDAATADDSATTADGDYTANDAQLDFAAGDVSESFTVQVNGDTSFEASESFLVELTNLQSNGRNVTIADASGRGDINDDDSAPTLSVANVTIEESDGAAVLAMTLDAPSGQPVSFFWSTEDNSAVASDDYTAVDNKAEMMPAGETRLELVVTINDDSLEELAETFTLRISSVSGAIAANSEAIVTINASDLDTPTVELSTRAPDGVSGMFEVAIDFSESVTGFDLADLALTNAIADNLTGSGASYTVEITPSADGRVAVELPAGAAQDGVGNASLGSNVLSREADGKSPTTTLSTGAPDLVSGTFQVVVEFSEDVSGLELADFTLLNAAADDLAGSGARYTVEVKPTADGAVSIELPAASAEDAAGNANTASNTITRQADSTAPELMIALPGSETLGAFTASFTFSEDVTGFELADISVANGAVSGLAGSGADYTVLVTPGTVGMVEIGVDAGAGADAAGNLSLAAMASIQAVSSANEITLVLGSDVGDPASVVDISTVTNPGSAPLGFDLTADVPWLDVDPVSGTVPSSGSIDLAISLNNLADALDAGDYVGTIKMITGGALLMEIPVSLSVEARYGGVTLIATTPSGPSGEAGFGYTSDIAEFDGLTLTSSGGRASASASGVLRGQYAITQSLPAGWRLDSISCIGDADSGSTFDVDTARAVIDLDPNESLICTFKNVRDEQLVRMATQRAIRNFMLRRADIIISSAPDLSQRFGERQSQGRGGMSANMSGMGFYQMNFSASLAGARNATAAAEADSGARYNHADDPFLDGWDIWLAAEMSGIRDDRAGERASTDFAMGQLGVDYALSENLIIGALGQYDWMDDKAREVFVDAGAVRGAEVQGNGWMVGPYMAWRVRDTLTFDALALYGQSDNRVNPLGFFSDDFETDRYMLRANLTGEFSSGPWTLRPQAGITHFEESQKGYTDSLGISIPGQDISLGRFRAGPELAWRGETDGGGWLQVSGAIDAIWDYDSADMLTESGQLTGGSGDLRADARVAFAAQTRWGPQLRFEFGLAGLGVGDFRAQTARFELRVPFGAAAGLGGVTPMGAGGFGPGAQCDISGGGIHSALASQSGCKNGLSNPTAR